MTARYVAALDQGTTSSRCLLFDRAGQRRRGRPAGAPPDHAAPGVGRARRRTRSCSAAARASTRRWLRPAPEPATWPRSASPTSARRSFCGSARAGARSPTRSCGRTRAVPSAWRGLGDVDRFREQTGLPLATYFSGPKLSWLLDSLPGARARAEAGELAAGTIDSWLAWQLAGVHVTDVTNASRTLLMDLRTLDWDDGLLDEIGVPRPLLAADRALQRCAGRGRRRPARGAARRPARGALRAMLLRPRRGQVHLRHRQLPRAEHRRARSAVASRAASPASPTSWVARSRVYMLEGSIAVTGALVQWLRDNLGLIEHAADSEALAASVPDSDGCVIVPAFSGLFAPRWRSDARGVICGLTRFHTKAHIARAALDATAYATRELVEAMVSRRGRRAAGAPGRRRHDRERPAHADSGGHAGPSGRTARRDRDHGRWARPTPPGLRSASGSRRRSCVASRAARPAGRPRAGEDERDRGYAAWNAAVERSLGWA